MALSDHVAVDQQIHAGLALVSAATDQELNVVPLDNELERRELAGRSVTTEERVDESLAFEAADLHLAAQRALGGGLAERFAFDLPVAVVRRLEVVDQDVVFGACRRYGCQSEEREGKTRNS